MATGSGKDAVWTDSGTPVVCTNGPEADDEPVAIDPAVFDDADGNKWMVWGSHGAGIYVSQLDADTGLLAANAEPSFSGSSNAFHHVAQNEEGEESMTSGIEAPYILHHGNYYYLFVNWGACCGGRGTRRHRRGSASGGASARRARRKSARGPRRSV